MQKVRVIYSMEFTTTWFTIFLQKKINNKLKYLPEKFGNSGESNSCPGIPVKGQNYWGSRRNPEHWHMHYSGNITGVCANNQLINVVFGFVRFLCTRLVSFSRYSNLVSSHLRKLQTLNYGNCKSKYVTLEILIALGLMQKQILCLGQYSLIFKL
jgi:hypothetical protein